MPVPQFPLATVNDKDLQGLCEALWDWDFCVACRDGDACEQVGCPGQRIRRLARFFKYYKDATATYGAYFTANDSRALSSHQDLFCLIKRMRESTELTRGEVRKIIEAGKPGAASTMVTVDQDRAINLAVGIVLMVECSTRVSFIAAVEDGASLPSWRENTRLSTFLRESFFDSLTPGLDGKGSVDYKETLTAYQLKKSCGLRFEATDDLRSHLRIVGNVIKVFHHVAYVKEQLRLTRSDESNPSTLHGRCCQPRQLLLEVLDSIQLLLFRRTDAKSFSMLRSLVSRSSFDPDCLNFESAALRTAQETENSYCFLRSRLEDLYAEIENPRPRGVLEAWLEKKSGARYVMMATLIGVAVAILLGMASLAVAIYQAWLAYQQWQHPIS